MRGKYTFKAGMKAEQHIGTHLGWGYSKRELIASMKGYAKQALEELGHAIPTRLAAAPSKMPRPQYGAKAQCAEIDDTEALPESKIKYLQRVLGKFLYYARANGSAMLHALSDIAGSVAKGAKATEKAVRHFMSYARSSPGAAARLRASGMRLAGGSDAACLVAPEARSRAGGCHCCTGIAGEQFNGPIHAMAKVIKNVMASAVEAEVAAMLMNARLMAEFRQALEDMGHPQPPAVARAGSEAGCGVLSGAARQRRPKVAGMSLSWLKGRCERGQFKVGWAPGPTSRAGYATKNHPGPHHQAVRPTQLYIKGRSPTALQWCGRATGAARAKPGPRGAEAGLAGKLKSLLPSASAKRLRSLAS